MRMHMGLAIDPDTNDLYLDQNNNLAVVHNAAAVAQHVRQRLKTFQGEWFLDTTAGVPWLAQIMGKQYDPALAEAVVKAEIMDTDAVVEITSFSVSFASDVRRLDIRDVGVMTEYDLEAQV